MSNHDKDRATLIAIGQIYCIGNHANVPKNDDGLCQGCASIIETTLYRTVHCPYNHSRNCQDCATKCQTDLISKINFTDQSNNAAQAHDDIRKMMSYAAPRMIWRHPLMTLQYLIRKINYRLKSL